MEQQREVVVKNETEQEMSFVRVYIYPKIADPMSILSPQVRGDSAHISYIPGKA